MSTIDTPNPFDDMQPRHTSACCNDCPWTAETISTSVLPLVKAHADEHRHNVTAHAWIKNDNEAPFIIAMVLIPPEADLVARFLS